MSNDAYSKVLKKGTSGEDVLRLQHALQQAGFSPGKSDSVFGGKTEEAVRKFQKDNQLTADGIVGKKTWASLQKFLTSGAIKAPIQSPLSTGPLNVTPEEFKLLTRLTEAEAGGEIYEGRVAVAASVLNRVESPAWPNTISKVIYQPGQYSPIQNGYINRVNPSEETIKAVQDAINGNDPSQGATTFYNPDKTSNRWLRSKPKTVKIEHHQFAKA